MTTWSFVCGLALGFSACGLPVIVLCVITADCLTRGGLWKTPRWQRLRRLWWKHD